MRGLALVNASLLLSLGALAAGCGSDEGTDASGRSPAPDAGLSPTVEPTEEGSLPARVPPGVWAGDQLILTVTTDGATAEFACAAGVLSDPLWLDATGRFDVPGSYTAHAGGPASSSESTEEPWPADYRGRLTDAAHLSLTVVLPRPLKTQGPYDLELGADQSLERCG